MLANAGALRKLLLRCAADKPWEAIHFFPSTALLESIGSPTSALCQVRPVENCTSRLGSDLKHLKGCMWTSCWCAAVPPSGFGNFFGTSTGREPPARNQLGIVLLAPPGGPNLAQVLRLGCRVTALGVVFVFRGLQARTLVDSSRVKKAASMNAASYHSPPSWSFLQQKQCAFSLAQTVVSGTMGPWLFQPIYRLHLHAFTVGFSKTPRLMLTSEQLINPSPIIR